MTQPADIVENFGGNQRFRPAAYCMPLDEAGVLDILTRHRGQKIRAIGSLHAWSEAAVVEGVLVDLRNMSSVRVERRNGGYWATVEGGCQIKRLLAELDRHGMTLPSLGLITEQTIAGATATGTHGSGKNSLSHYLAEVRIATYDPQTGEAVIRTIREGPELRAARCSLGLLGIVVSVSLWCRPQYMIEEEFRLYPELDEVLAAEAEYPLQQFYVLPWLWKYLAQHRREVNAPRSRSAWLYRLYWYFGIDIGMHLIVLALARVFGGAGAVQFYFRRIGLKLAIRRWCVVDKSQEILVMEHELFRHIEIELFVERPKLKASLDYVREIIETFAGNEDSLTPTTRERLSEAGLLEELTNAAGVYTHHYVICIRRVLPDDTLISMASGTGEDWYAISLISYARPNERAGFMRFAHFLAKSMAKVFAARPHWGKVCSLDANELEILYPNLPEFRAICEAYDPQHVFRNTWTERVVFGASPRQSGG